MATAHLSVHGVVSRGKGESIVATAAYNARARLVDEQTGEVHDYRYLGKTDWSGTFAKEAPAWANDLQRLVNELERSEKRRDSQLALNLDIALPCEHTVEQNRRLLQDFVRESWMRQGYLVRVDMHRPDPEGDPRNFHAHVWVSLRKIDAHGFAKTKGEQQELYRNRKEYVEQLRQKWEKLANRHLERNGFDARIDMRSLQDQGIDREPQQHKGPTLTAMEREGRADHSHVLADIRQRQHQAVEERALKAAEKRIDAQIIDLQVKRAEREAREAAKGRVDSIRALDSSEEKSQEPPPPTFSQRAAEPSREAVQEQYAAADPSAPQQPTTRPTEPEREAANQNLREAAAVAEVPAPQERASNFVPEAQEPELEQTAGQVLDKAASFGSRVFGWLAERFESVVEYLASFAPEPPKTKEQTEQVQRAADEVREWKAIEVEQQERDERLRQILQQVAREDAQRQQSLAERFGRNAVREHEDEGGRERERDRGYELE